MSKPKRNFENLAALISGGEKEVESRRLTVVGEMDSAAPEEAAVPAVAEAVPATDLRPAAETRATARLDGPAETVAPGPNGRPGVQKLSLQLTDDTIAALYAWQLQERKKRRKRADTTIGWVADALLRGALGLPQIDGGA